MIHYSIIVPICNEEGAVVELCKQIKETMDKIAPLHYELIFVNDGSTDASLDKLKLMATQTKELIILNLDKNYGQSCAFQAGFDNSEGQIIITLDGDMQNDPEDIQKLLDKMNEGYDVVCGWRKKKYTTRLKMCASRMANCIRRVLFNEKIHDAGCSFRAYTKRSLSGINLDGCKHRFLTAILTKKGLRLGETEIKSCLRVFGVSKYGIIDRFFWSIPEIINVYFSKSKALSAKRGYKINEIIKHQCQ